MTYDKPYYEERKKELFEEAAKLKVRHSEKVFQLCVELDADLKQINAKIVEIVKKEEASKSKTQAKKPQNGATIPTENKSR